MVIRKSQITIKIIRLTVCVDTNSNNSSSGVIANCATPIRNENKTSRSQTVKKTFMTSQHTGTAIKTLKSLVHRQIHAGLHSDI